jgi:hypothetical protein
LAERFYPRFAAVPIRFVLRGRLRHDTSLVLIYTDKIPVKRNRQAVEKAIKLECSKELGGRPFYIYHHPSTSNSWLQIVDYACLAYSPAIACFSCGAVPRPHSPS